MIVACNFQMQNLFIPSWISCYDEPVSVWMNKLMCTGFFFSPHKPHPNFKEYHTLFCGESAIMYGWEIIDGRYHLIPMGRPEFETIPNMKIIGLVI